MTNTDDLISSQEAAAILGCNTQIQHALKACEEDTTPVKITDLSPSGPARFAMVGGFCIRLHAAVGYSIPAGL